MQNEKNTIPETTPSTSPEMQEPEDTEWENEWEYELLNEYIPSSTAGDYGPGNPWDAPGMSIRDFI